MGWTPDALPDLTGKTYVVTGGNGGLGLEATKLLCAKGAQVVITTRKEDAAKDALQRLRAEVPQAVADYVLLDLAEPKSVAEAAEALRARCPRLDALVNNAGVMQPPLLRTSEGHELQLATNHLGHFRLNAALFPLLEASGGRIVPVASIAHRMGRIDLDDLDSERSYDPTVRYAQSKLANLMYSFELQRRLTARGSKVTSIACHPGYAATNLQTAGVSMEGGSSLFRWLYKATNAVVAQSATRGAWPLVLAAADPTAKPGGYYGPTGIGQARGPVGESYLADVAKDLEVARRLWEWTERAVGPFFPA
jgi:NAD(P)-dependent dehydrogenase (short-subunit alcohol dehydrogenase family)